MAPARRQLWLGVLAALIAEGAWWVWRAPDAALPGPSPSGATAAARVGAGTAKAAVARPAPLEPTSAADLARAFELDDLSRRGTPQAVEALAAAAVDPRLGGRAAAALGQVHNREAAPALLALATGDGPALVRANAVQALATSGSHQEAPALIRLLSDGEQPLRVRVESALTLGALRDDTAVPAMGRLLRGDDVRPAEIQLRLAIEQALASIGSKGARAALAAARPASPDEQRLLTALTGR